jgi:hypothetical protein
VVSIITTRPEDVLDYHARLTADFRNPRPMISSYLVNFMTDATTRGGRELGRSMFYPVLPADYRTITREHGTTLSKIISRDLSDAITYEVTTEMTRIMREVYEAQTVETTTIEQAELPCESGFAWLDEGWPIRDRHGDPYTIRALSWHFTTALTDGTMMGGKAFSKPVNWPCVRTCLWVHPNDDPAEFRDITAESISEFGALQLIHVGVLPFSVALFTSPEERGPAESFLNLLHLLWMFLGMEITGTHQPRIKNYYRKHALKSLVHGEVHVVILRKVRYVTEKGDQEAQHVDWSCRWPVAGHYRHLTNPAQDGKVHHAVPIDADKHCAVCNGQLTWVRPYLKGPDGKPLKVSRTLMKLAR